MPRVEKGADVTIVALVYRSLRWLDWCMESVDNSSNQISYRWLVVANDATDEVRKDPRITIDFRNKDPNEFYINRVYRAWNQGIVGSPTQLVCIFNTDMYASDGWLDELVTAKRNDPKTLPASMLVESGSVPSAMPEYVHNFGMNPDEFKKEDFLQHAKTMRRPGEFETGRLYGPVIFDRQEFIDFGKYPEGNPGGVPGDQVLFKRYKEAGYKHITCLGSVVYHAVTGEQLWP
ncbi:hypothetical protein A3F38_00425 [Candidatus Saccharibacteria bacterium RIFCSPHIGHO2_12_FULL_48_21]|nr:MAG: hypothetical protein A3F38_00425 [Candidatus Saccharibacteria bacterium RIFCSPHIGHO2_12_FULL_48_21]